MRALLALVALSAVALQASSTAAAPTATYLPADKVAAAFAKGMPLVEVDNYKVHASRREAPGMVEVHNRDTDIVYVLDGTATVVLGGQVIGGKTIASDEIRGSSITGSTETRHLVKGDVLIVPNGMPHWFTEVQVPFLYYVVKVTAPAGGGSQ